MAMYRPPVQARLRFVIGQQSNETRRPRADSVRALRGEALVLDGSEDDYTSLIERIGNARVVLLGEASHGTHEFYAERTRITRRLVTELGFNAVAIEGDWPDAHRVNRYLRRADDDATPEQALLGFQRFPTWMWRNSDVVELVGWLRRYNDAQESPLGQVGFYGLDLYSLYSSIDCVIRYLDRVDPAAAARARDRYACFETSTGDEHGYGRAVMLGVSEPCRREAVAQLVELRRLADGVLHNDGHAAEDEQFFAEENARAVTDAEEYYRSMFTDPSGSWNLRDRHMADTLDNLIAHLDRRTAQSKVVVWAHNSHVGDARATESARRGELTLGQLARERYGRDAVLVGMTTYDGTVTAAADWGASAQRWAVTPALADSLEELLHSLGIGSFLIIPEPRGGAYAALSEIRLQRAIGVVYRPQTERQSHFLYVNAAERFDVIVHIDRSSAVTPLDRPQEWVFNEPPEAYPTAL